MIVSGCLLDAMHSMKAIADVWPRMPRTGMAKCMYGCVDVWNVCMYGCGCMDVWMYVCMYGCMYGCMYVGIKWKYSNYTHGQARRRPLPLDSCWKLI